MTELEAALDALFPGARREVNGGIIDLTSGPVHAHYDRIAPFYDGVMGLALYQRLAWRSAPESYIHFARRVFDSAPSGPHVELGCGSLLFTLPLYDGAGGRPIVLIDQSIAMLRRARAKLVRRHGHMPERVALVRADARQLTVARGAATTVLSLHVLHVVDDGAALLRALSALGRSDGCTIGLTTIVHTGGRGDRFLAFMHAVGELARPRDLATVRSLVADELPGQVQVATEGSMAFVTVRR